MKSDEEIEMYLIYIKKQTARLADGRTDRQTDRERDRERDRQTDRPAYMRALLEHVEVVLQSSVAGCRVLCVVTLGLSAFLQLQNLFP
jgi:hypothetical protein